MATQEQEYRRELQAEKMQAQVKVASKQEQIKETEKKAKQAGERGKKVGGTTGAAAGKTVGTGAGTVIGGATGATVTAVPAVVAAPFTGGASLSMIGAGATTGARVGGKAGGAAGTVAGRETGKQVGKQAFKAPFRPVIAGQKHQLRKREKELAEVSGELKDLEENEDMVGKLLETVKDKAKGYFTLKGQLERAKPKLIMIAVISGLLMLFALILFTIIFIIVYNTTSLGGLIY